MMVGRFAKETTDVRRITVDFGQYWSDIGEMITTVSTPVITLEPYAPSPLPYQQVVPPAPPPDIAPLGLVSVVRLPGNLQVQIFLNAGTPGLSYRVTFIGTGSSLRQQTIEFIISVKAP